MSQNNRWAREDEWALKAATAGSNQVLNHSENLTVTTKSSFRDVVTDLDVAVESTLRGILAISGHPILGEEDFSKNGLPIDLGPKGTERPFWAIDPIDGTANFINGIPLYAVSVGFFDGAFSAGAVSLPALKELFFTHGTGAYLNGKPITAKDSTLATSLVVECFSGDTALTRNSQYALFGALNEASRGCLRLGSAATSLCYLACGRIQAVVGIENEIWDVAGGLAVAARAGYEIAFSRTGHSTKISYIVGGPTVAGEIKDLLNLTLSQKERPAGLFNNL